MNLFEAFDSKCHANLKKFISDTIDLKRYTDPNTSKVNILKSHRSQVERILEEDTLLIFGSLVPIDLVMFFYVPKVSEYTQPIHVDTQILQGRTKALNYPIVGCDHGEMRWYSGSYQNEVSEIISSDGVKVKYLTTRWDTEPVLIGSKVIDTPHIVRTDIPHQVLNFGNSDRVMVSVRYDVDLP